jgi:putative ABC transport system permease protein
VPLARTSSPLVERYLRLARGDRSAMAKVIGARAAYQSILRLELERGRFVAAVDEQSAAAVCVLGQSLARQLFGYRNPVGDTIRIGTQACLVIGVLRGRRAAARVPAALAWRDLDTAAIVPLRVLSGRTLAAAPDQPVDEIWLQLGDGARVDEIGRVFAHTLNRLHGGTVDFETVVPRELLAQRYRTQRTFAVVAGAIAALALLVGGIGIMNVMLTSVIERTGEIGLRRTVGATRRDVAAQFLLEALLMTLTGGLLGIALGTAASWTIATYTGWATHISPGTVVLAFGVSMLTGVTFGWYPAIRAARLEPVDAVRYE